MTGLRRAFVVNPASAGCPRDLGGRILRRFPGARVRQTRGPGDGGSQAALAVEEGARVLVACGGDGTVREVATAAAAAGATLGLVPVGMVNLLASELGLPRGVEGALQVVEEGRTVDVYPGRCEPQGGTETLFFLCVTAGPDADAVHAVGRDKRFLGRYAYGLRFALRLLRPLTDEVAWDEGGAAGRRGRCAQFLCLKLPHYAGRYRVSEAVSPYRPGLEAVAVAGGRGRVLRFFAAALGGRVRPLRGVSRFPVTDVVLHLPGHGRFQVDGDPFTAPAVRLTAGRDPLRVLAPAGACCGPERTAP
ncbi:MAG: diacylglycerol kinase family protein [Deferrisomatales bacterium]|nr:diacylglycerol kinase family protein [Deferrisomatales bacterium]